MKALLFISALIPFLVNCDGHVCSNPTLPNIDHSLNVHDPYFDSYSEELEAIIERPLVNRVIIRFLEEREREGASPNINGVCYHYKNVIVLNKEHWDKAIIERRLALLLHEMGHCLFALDHTQKEVSDPCDNKIMHPNTTCTFFAFIKNDDETIKKEIAGK